MFFKNLNTNHKNLEDEKLWTRDRYIQYSNARDTWIQLTYNDLVRIVSERIDSTDKLIQLFTDLWIKEEKMRKTVILTDTELSVNEIRDAQLDYFINNQLSGKNPFWMHIFLLSDNLLITPYDDMSMGLRERIRNREKRKIIAAFNRNRYIGSLLENTEIEGITPEKLEKKLRIKSDKFDGWRERLEKRGYWEEDEQVLFAGNCSIARSNWKVRSNLTRQGRFIITNKRIVYIRRRFSLFNFAAMIPLLAYVRPSNKVIIVAQYIYQSLKIPLQALKGFRPLLSNFWTYAISLSIALPYLDLDKINLFFDNLFSRFPVLAFVGVGIDFAIENPGIITAFAGAFTGIRLGFLRALMRREELIVIPLDQISTLQLDGNRLITRLRLKGSQLVKAPENGIEFRIAIRDNEGNTRDVAHRIYRYLLTRFD